MSQDTSNGRFMYASTLKIGSSSSADTAPPSSEESGGYEAISREGNKPHGEKKDFERLAKEILELDDIKSCTIINLHGTVLAQMLGELPEDHELIEKGGTIAAVMWGGLMKVEPLAGPLNFVSAIFEKYKFVGIPFPDARIATVLVVDVHIDSFHLRDIVSNYVRYWFNLG